MTERKFIKEILFKRYPLATLFMLINELIGATLVVLGIGSLIPLLGSLTNGKIESHGKLGELITFLGLDHATTNQILLFFGIILSARVLLDMLRTYIGSVIAADISQNLKLHLNHRINQAKWMDIARLDLGRYMQTMSVEATLASGAVNDLAGTFANAILITTFVAALLIFSWPILIIVILAAAVPIFIGRIIIRKTQRLAGFRITLSQTLNNTLIENQHTMKLVRAENTVHLRKEKTADLIKKLRFAEQRQAFYAAATDAYGAEFGIIMICALSFLFLNFNLGNGNELIFTLLLIQRLSTHYNMFQSRRRNMVQKIPSYAACIDLINEIPECVDFVEENPRSMPELHSNWELENVFFSYFNQPPTFQNLSIILPAHGIIGIIGPSGSGKTTLIDILLGLLEPSSGSIKIDGVPFSEINMQAWHAMIAYVPQNAYLFAGTIRENLIYGLNELSDENIWDALEHAKISDFIRLQPNGLEMTILSGGANLSGGERQRLCIARAFLRKSRILIMDEPSSALDPKTARDIMLLLKSLADKMLILVVTHSVELVDDMHHVLMINQGKCEWVNKTQPQT